MSTANKIGALLAIVPLGFSAEVAAVPPDLRSDENLSVRLLLGRLDGAENDTVLRDDGHRYTLGISASSPVAWEERVQANLEIWVGERGYGTTSMPTGAPADNLTLQSAALTYGLRLQGGTALHPYGMVALGFQATRLHAETRDTPAVVLREDTLEPTVHVGAGIEWRVGRDLFALDWRRWYIQGDFSEFGLRDAELGGDFLGIGLGHRF